MTKLISGRYEKVPSANVSADRYEFLSIQEAEPDLGLPTALGQVFTSNLTGTRTWVNLSTSTIQEGSNLFYTDARVLANVSAMSINVLTDVYITQPNLNDVLSWDGTKFIAQAATAAAVAGTANVAYFANVANSVISLEGHTTTEIAEGANLYFTNARVIAALTDASLLGNLTVRNLFANSVITTDLVANVITANSFVSTGVGVPTLSSATNINLSANGANGGAVVIQSSALRLKTYTYAEANALTSSVGDVVYNSNSKSVLAYNGIVWEESGSKLALLKADTILANSLIVNGNEIVTGTTGEANLVVTRITANVWNNLYTANVIETAGNLYFTNTRVVAALRAGNNIIIEANGRISANVTTITLNTSQVTEASSNLYFTNARVIAALSGLSNLTITGTFRSNAIITNSIIVNGNEIVTGASGEANLSVGKLTANIGVFNELSANNITATGNLILGSGVGGNILGLNRLVVSDIYSNVIYSNSIIVNGNEIVNGTSGGINLSVSRITANTIFANVGLFSSLTGNNISSPGNIVLGSGSGGNITGVSSIETTTLYSNAIYSEFVISSIWSGIYTANVIETAGNLYFTNTRARAVFTAGDNVTIEANGRISANVTLGSLGSISTDNVSEGVNNLYFTNARVVSALIAGDNVKIEPNGRISANVTLGSLGSISTDNVSEGVNNLYFTNTRARAVFTAGDNVTIEANGRISANVTLGSLGSISTDNVSEGVNNLYFTNARAVTAITPSLTTSNVTELTNLYYTNSRVVSAVTPLLTTANVTELTNLYYTNSRVVSAVTPLLTTANVTELTNLYFTNARARAAITGGTGVVVDWNTGAVSIGQNVSTTSSVTFRNVSITNNLIVYGGIETFGANNLVVSDNMIYLNSGSINSNPDIGIAFNYNDGTYHHAGFFRDATDGVFKVFENYLPEPDANIFIDTDHATFRVANLQATTFIGNVSGTVSSLSNHNTDDLAEGTNKYYTNARVLVGITTGTVQGNITVSDTIIANSFLSGGGTGGQITGAALLSATNITATNVTATAWFGLYTANVIESPANLYFTNTRVVAALVAGNNVTIEPNGRISANVTDSLGAVTTDNISEGVNNLYFTNARARAVFTAGDNVTIEANGRISANLTTTIANITAVFDNLTTDGVNEGSVNLYYTNSRVVSAITPSLTTANVSELGNLYFTGARAVSAVTPLLTTANVAELTNLYYTNARVLIGITTGAVQGNITVSDTIFANNFVTATGAGGTITGASLISTANLIATEITASSWFNLYTANVIETSANLYFTNARVVSALIAGTGIIIEANGRISANISTGTATLTTDDVNEGANLYFTNARVRAVYSEGSGIAISESGVISTRGNDTGLGAFNSGINLEGNAVTSAVFSNVKVFNSFEGNSFLAFSFHITNLGSNTSYLTGRTITDGNTILFANLLEVPVGGSLEIFRKPQVFRVGDSIQVQGLNQFKIPDNDLLSTYVSYQGTADDTFRRSATTLVDNTLVQLYQTLGRASIIESINLVNLGPDIIPATVTLTDSSDYVRATLASNLQIPAYSSIELCEYPKTLPENWKIKAQKFGSSPAGLSVYTSSKFTSSYAIAADVSSMTESGRIAFNIITTNVIDGTILWYETQAVSGNVNAADFVTANTGYLTVQNSGARLTLFANADLNTNFEGDETFKLVLRKASNVGPIVTTTDTLILRDTSNTIVYQSLISNADTIVEGGSITFVLDTTNLGPNEVLYYSTVGNVTSADFVTGNTGSFISTGNTYTLVLTTS
jgi:hypothetical protein